MTVRVEELTPRLPASPTERPTFARHSATRSRPIVSTMNCCWCCFGGGFAEFLETSAEAWIARMISPELIAAHSKYLAAQRGDRHFIPECRRLMDAVKDGIISAFSTEIANGVLADHWGRVGVECVLKKLPQWLFFGVY